MLPFDGDEGAGSKLCQECAISERACFGWGRKLGRKYKEGKLSLDEELANLHADGGTKTAARQYLHLINNTL